MATAEEQNERELWKERELERKRLLAKEQEWERKKKKLLALMDEMTYEQIDYANTIVGVRSFEVNLQEKVEAAKQLKIGDWVKRDCSKDMGIRIPLDYYDGRVMKIWKSRDVRVMTKYGECYCDSPRMLRKVDKIDGWNWRLEASFWIKIWAQKIGGMIESWKQRRKKEGQR